MFRCDTIFLKAFRYAKALLVSIIFFPLLAACGGASDETNLESFDRPYAYLSNGRPEAAWDKHWPKPTYVIRTETEFRSAWESREIPGNKLIPPLPEVDFSNFMLLGVSGEKTLPCVTLRITKVRQEGDELVVESKRSNNVPPGGGCLFAQVPLFDFVLVPSTPFRVRFLPTTVVSGG